MYIVQRIVCRRYVLIGSLYLNIIISVVYSPEEDIRGQQGLTHLAKRKIRLTGLQEFFLKSYKKHAQMNMCVFV